MAGMSVPADLTAITLPDALTDDIDRAGYYPALVVDIVRAAVGTEEIFSHLVHQETTFDQDAVRRHITVFARTSTRLVIAHADDFADPTVDAGAREVATATTECIPLSAVRGVMLTHVVPDPEHYDGSLEGRAVTLTLGWGAVARVDLLPAGCEDPECEGDHGYEGTVAGDDISLRIAAGSDGVDRLAQALTFAQDLSARLGR